MYGSQGYIEQSNLIYGDTCHGTGIGTTKRNLSQLGATGHNQSHWPNTDPVIRSAVSNKSNICWHDFRVAALYLASARISQRLCVQFLAITAQPANIQPIGGEYCIPLTYIIPRNTMYSRNFIWRPSAVSYMDTLYSNYIFLSLHPLMTA